MSLQLRQPNLAALALSVVAGATAGILARRVLGQSKKKESNNPFGLPGPPKDDPQAGNLGALAAAGGVLPYSLEIHRKYGEICCIWWGEVPVVCLGSTKALKDVRHLTERPFMFFATSEQLIGARSIQFAKGTDWSDRRKIYNHPLSNDAIYRREHALLGPRDWLINHVDAAVAKKQSVMCRNMTFAVALRGITTFAYGDVFTDEEEIALLLEAYDESMRVLMGAGEKTAEDEASLQKSLSQFRRASEVAIAKRKVVHDSGEDEEILLDTMSQRLDPETLLHDFITFFIAGFHTSGNSLVWLFYHLCLHPEYQDKIVAELNTAPNAPIDLPTAEKSPTLVNCLDESLRYEAVGSFGARGNPDGPVTVLGHEFPADTNFLLSFGPCTAEGPEFEDPRVFNPDRWIPKDGSNKRPQYTMPFGLGKRKCPGMDFAVVEAKLLAAALLNKYKLSLADPDFQMERNLTFVPTPASDFAINLVPR